MLPGKQYRLEDIILIAWRRRWLLILPFVVITSGTVLAAMQMPNRYRSETLILVVPQRVPESYVRSTVTMRIEDRLQSLRQEILSRSRLERIIKDFDLYAEARKTMAMEDVVASMRKAITTETVRGDAFRVAYISHDPDLAQAVTERLASLFIDENVRDRAVLADATSDFLQSQLDTARQHLIEQEKKLEAYRLQYAGELPSQAAANVEALRTIRLQLQSLADQLVRDNDRRISLENQLAELATIPAASVPTAVPASAPAPATDPGSATAQLAEARERLASLRLRLTAEHPDVAATERTIRRLEPLAREEAQLAKAAAAAAATPAAAPATTPAESMSDRRSRALQTELSAVMAQITVRQREEARLRDEMAVYRARLEAAPIRESELIELTRDYETLQSIYRNLLAKREDSKIAANLERRQVGEQFRVLDPARVPERPYSPNRLRMSLTGAALGFVLSLALIAVREYNDTSFKTEEEIRAWLKLPVIATIPDIESSNRWRSLWQWSWRGLSLRGRA